MEQQLMQWASLGVGGILAGIMFWFYRQDRMDSHKQWHELQERLNHQSEDRHKQMVEMHRESLESSIETRTVLRELTAMLRERS